MTGADIALTAVICIFIAVFMISWLGDALPRLVHRCRHKTSSETVPEYLEPYDLPAWVLAELYSVDDLKAMSFALGKLVGLSPCSRCGYNHICKCSNPAPERRIHRAIDEAKEIAMFIARTSDIRPCRRTLTGEDNATAI